MSRFVVVVSRHPDFANDYRVFTEPDAEPVIVDMDYGARDLRDPEEFEDWAVGHRQTARELRGQGLLQAADYVEEMLREATEEYQG